MDYHNYKTEDFLNDKSFVKWVVDPENDTLNQWENFLIKYPEKREEFQVAIGLVHNVRPNVGHQEIDGQVNQIWNALEEKLASQKSQNRSTQVPKWLINQWVQIAATLLIVTGLSFVAYTYIVDATQSLALAESNMVIKSNPKGRKSTVTLSDKTRVDLNAESSIEYLSNFNDDIREVSLIGEAFFNVERDETRPFIIKVNGIDVKVLGTSFNIKAYPGDKQIEVAVLSGNVEVTYREKGNTVNLVKNELAYYHYDSNNFSKKQIEDIELIFAWKEQKLVFKNQDLSSLMETLSRWYGVDIDYGGIVNKKKQITGSYQNASLREVMMGLAHNYQFEYEINGKQVKIYNQ